jgi:hypothetical protein
MTTSTLEMVDLERLLDAEPVCENPGGCERTAVNNVWITCGCGGVLACQRHTDLWLEQARQWLDHSYASCKFCGRRWYGCDCDPSDVLRVVPL